MREVDVNVFVFAKDAITPGALSSSPPFSLSGQSVNYKLPL